MWLLFYKMMAWKDTQMFSSNLFTESAASEKMHLVISLLILSSVFRMFMLRMLGFQELLHAMCYSALCCPFS